ncbi:hypothetical protein COEREDRAFT_98144 [Coemansia reversa NRRL 1564]|uniref:Uncharacterized protein n=1 Tax=Coemansia reversa (strain ATCC 12441 / NRRL 1564) TaxID=763665 RepID=A0A2G5B8R3_COERN|nr:hypothetical protein COEREDRAFT_98144 [Coemansia reversa NRRL 1564]|eukprot:PIA15408.1 hypothetical protein COEREDRAFT_98144 [Coemansia reversa NRRL 1564]
MAVSDKDDIARRRDWLCLNSCGHISILNKHTRLIIIRETIFDVQLIYLDNFEGLKSLRQNYEGAMVVYFIEYMDMVTIAQTTFLSEELKLWPVLAYTMFDHQNTPVSGGRHKIDCVFHSEMHRVRSLSSANIPIEAKSFARSNVILSKDFGQMADDA